MADFNLFSTIEDSMTKAIEGSVSEMSGSWAGTMVSLLGMSFALTITLTGALVVAGKIQQPLEELFWKLGAILMVIAFR